MGKIKILLALFVMSMSIQLNAQKVFSTKAGQILFNATGGAVKIAAVNNQVDSKFGEATGQIIFAVLIKGFKFCTQQLIVISHPIICNYLYKILIKILSKILAFANKPVSNCS